MSASRSVLSLLFMGVMAAALASAADVPSITLPIVEVREIADHQVKTFPGRVVPIAQVNVVPQVAGEILEVAFENGAIVKEGALLYRLDPVKYEAAVKNAEAKVAECRANLSYAELSYTRHKKLVKSHAVSLDAADNALSSRDAARAALAAAQADLISAKDALAHCRITAPISGKIGSTVRTKGNYVTAGSETLVTLVQAAPIRVRFSLSNREFLDMFGGRNSRICKEAKIALNLANGEAFAEDGMVEYVDNAADERTDTIQVYALFPNAEYKLKPGGTVSVTLTSDKGVARPAVPPAAVLQDTQGPYVWAIGADGRAERRTIARGDLSNDLLIIEKGLKAGERIVGEGAHRVKRGMLVKAAK